MESIDSNGGSSYERLNDVSKQQNNVFTTILINARSLAPKLDSFVVLMDELEGDIACITESWFTAADNQNLEDFQNRTNIGLIRREREDRRGGGVCIAYDMKHIQMTRCKVPNSKHEIVAAIGRRTA